MKIPENPRYKHVEPVVDSGQSSFTCHDDVLYVGASMTKHLEHLEEIRKSQLTTINGNFSIFVICIIHRYVIVNA